MRIALWFISILVVLFAGLVGAIYIDGHRTQPSPAQYVAMGSSFASVVTTNSDTPGTPWIVDRVPGSPWLCSRSSDNYAHQLARLQGVALVDVSCGGAETKHILQGGQMFQPPQLDALRPETELVTVTIGGNDVRFIGDLSAFGCALRDGLVWKLVNAITGCKTTPPAEVEDRLRALPARFDRIAAEVHQRSPKARLVLLTYQTVLPPAGTCARLGLTEAQADQMRKVADAFAGVVRDAAARNGAILFDAAGATAGHDVCSSEPWITDQRAHVPLHTTLQGMTAIAQGLAQLLSSISPSTAAQSAAK